MPAVDDRNVFCSELEDMPIARSQHSPMRCPSLSVSLTSLRGLHEPPPRTTTLPSSRLSVHEDASPTSGKESQARCHCPSVQSVLPASAQRAKAWLYGRPWLSSRRSTLNLSSHAPLAPTTPAGTSRAGRPAKPRPVAAA